MPGGKSIYVSGQSCVVRCLTAPNLLQTGDEWFRFYKVDKGFGKFYYFNNRASKQHVGKNKICIKKEWILILKLTLRQD